MTESIRLPEPPVTTGGNELDESMWQAWQARNALRVRQLTAARLVAVKCASLAVLLTATILWGYLGAYQVAIRFALAVGALVVAGQAWRLRSYGFAAVFLAITVVFNPIVAIFPMNGGWPFPVVFVTVLAFIASLIWLREEPAGDPRYRAASEGAPTERSVVKTQLSDWENEGGASADPELLLAGGERKGARK